MESSAIPMRACNKPAIARTRAVEFLARCSSSLTIERITAHAAIAAVLVWLMFIINLSRRGLLDRLGDLKGTDFLQFYAAGSFASAHRIAEMYGVHQFAAATARAVPGVKGWHYLPVYPPQVALMFWPFAHAAYLAAFAMWTMVNFLLYAGCVAIMAHCYPKIREHRVALILAALAFPPFFNAVGHGQLSILLLVCVVASFYAFVREDRFLAGLALGGIAFKPPLFLAFLLVWIVVRDFRVIAGMIINGAGQLAVVCGFAGLNSVRAYLEFAVRLPRVDDLVLAVKPYQMHSLRSFWMVLGAGRFATELWLLSSLAVLVILARFWRREPAKDLLFAALTVAALLIDPHLYIYDVVIIAPALVVAIERARLLDKAVADGIRVGVYVLFVCLFLGPLSAITHLQLSVLMMLALFCAMTRATSSEAGRRPSAALLRG